MQTVDRIEKYAAAKETADDFRRTLDRIQQSSPPSAARFCAEAAGSLEFDIKNLQRCIEIFDAIAEDYK